MAPPRTMRPVYVDRLPPCNHACPAGENVQSWLAEAQAGRNREAWEILVRDNPMPAVHGRVCYHPCEDACNRKDVDEAVSIHAVERFLGDMALAQGWTVAPDEPPSAPTGARRRRWTERSLSRLAPGAPRARGCHPRGGTDGRRHDALRHPEVPPATDSAGRRDRTHPQNRRRDRPESQGHGPAGREDRRAFDAVFLAVGAHLSKRQEIPARDAGKVYDALQFLKQVETGGESPRLGRRVAIYGGGNTAMDAARTAARLGAEPLIIYRRTREQMPAHDFEADEAIEEGVKIHWLRTIKEIDGTTLTVEVMRLDENRPSGADRPVRDARSRFADSRPRARHRHDILEERPGHRSSQADGTVVVGRDMQTGCPGVFAGGDMVPYARTVTTAVGHGKKAARYIDAWLHAGGAVEADEARNRNVRNAAALVSRRGETARPEHDRPRADGDTTFDEVVAGLDPTAARYEAQRCLSCGNCFECDGCYSACPEQAVIKLGPGRRYEYDLDKCTGCAICYDQCPCGAITMIPEPVATIVTAVVGRSRVRHTGRDVMATSVKTLDGNEAAASSPIA